MKHQALFPQRENSKKKKKCRLQQFLYGAIRVKEQLVKRISFSSVRHEDHF